MSTSKLHHNCSVRNVTLLKRVQAVRQNDTTGEKSNTSCGHPAVLNDNEEKDLSDTLKDLAKTCVS
jgi:hypothetical protein